MRLYRKLYSKKHDEAWYKGEETERQKKDRKSLASALTGYGTVVGAGAGYGLSGQKRIVDKISEISAKDYRQRAKAEGVVRNTAGRVHPKDAEAYAALVKEVEEKLRHNEEATKRFIKRADKLTAKYAKKNALKGAGVGLAIAGGGALALNKAMKSANEKGNAARRNKNKTKK